VELIVSGCHRPKVSVGSTGIRNLLTMKVHPGLFKWRAKVSVEEVTKMKTV